jgi:hypothetical protein
MTIQIGRYNFEGPFPDPASLKDQSGVYAILGVNAGQQSVLVDVGESATVRSRVNQHDRTPQWTRRGHQGLHVAALYIGEPQRMVIERELRTQYNPPCGDR